ncbi:hypothetical protein BDM02DRAFT_3271277 [Thelephora ganbajun]|uniref:Uncharacterized protein n=1 Tax=Thelephora ganbajun TaxID=370292 RepID=A0ACB6Z8W4_THEGA|nr:hypothetical protein BDM02DRAFT_3271277 [Thelephora ganbajun]
MAAGAPAEVETPVGFIPQNLPAAPIDINTPYSVLRSIVSPSTPCDVEPPSETCVNIPATTVSSPTLSISTISDLTPTEFGEVEHSQEQTTAHHDTFYFEDGNVEIVCGDTVFRVHSTIISYSSSKLRDILSPPSLLSAPMLEGRPRITVSDSAEDFAVLLKMIYTPGFLGRKKVPNFSIFASLLRMTTKYGFSDVREGLVEDLEAAYPTKWEDFETAKIIGKNIFGSPKPHPNAVLNLLLEQRVRFALPFAAYRAGLGGSSALSTSKPGIALPRPILASIIHGMGEIRRMMTHAAYGIVYVGNLRVCPEKACVLNVGINPAERRVEALKKISDVMVKKSEGDVLSSLSFGNLVCTDCANLLKYGHRDCCKELVWAKLPSLLGWESWEGI